MGALVVTRRQQPVTYTGSGQKQIVQLNKGLLYRALMLRLTGAATTTIANNTAALTSLGDEWGVIKKVEIIANGSDVLFSMSGNDLWWYNRLWYDTFPHVTPTIGDGATANPAFDSTLIIPFWSPRSSKKIDTALFSGEFSDFRLEITWGTFTDINSAATAFTTNPVVEVGSTEQEPSVLPPVLRRIIKYVQQPAGANAAFRIPLDVGPMYRGFLINTTNTAGTTESAAQFSNVKLVSGSTVYADISEPMLQQSGNLLYGIPFGIEKTTAGIAYQTTPRISTSSSQAAWYNFDLVQDGYLTEAINTSSLSELYLEFNVTGACTINVLASQLIPLNRKTATPAQKTAA